MNFQIFFKNIFLLSLFLGSGLLLVCSSSSFNLVKADTITEDDYDPVSWSKIYPLEYKYWLKTKEPKPAGTSKYKKGWDTDLIIYDKLSEFPYMFLLFNGWGFGVEYNEPRGHHYMLIDQSEIDPSRLKAGGSCLTCKTPFASKLKEEMGEHYFSDCYLDLYAKIPKKFQQLGVACIDCHNKTDASLKLSRWTLQIALKGIGKEPNTLSKQDSRSAVCAQCHISYIIKKNIEGKSADLILPWQGSNPSNISVENIIKVIRSAASNLEWEQKVSGFKFGFIRHPDYELFTKKSIHFEANVTCADCHMPYLQVGINKISDHDITSPLKKEMRACQQCHSQSSDWLKSQVIAIQDRTVSLVKDSGYACAVVAKLFELTHKAQKEGKNINQTFYDKAKELYIESFYRVIFVGAENSGGFHNPQEVSRICTDAITMANKSKNLLKEALARVNVNVELPINISLEIAKYVENREIKKPKHRQEFNFTPN
jgi:nitrite reductase (cytochrome c-552)